MTWNWVDAVVLGVLLYHFYRGLRSGILLQIVHAVTMVVALLAAIQLTSRLGNVLGVSLGMPTPIREILAFFIISFILELVFAEVLYAFLRLLPQRFSDSSANRVLGGMVALFKGLVYVTAITLILLVFPLRGTLQSDVRQSLTGFTIERLSERYFDWLPELVRSTVTETVRFLTILPESDERVKLDLPASELELRNSPALEVAMVRMVNDERIRQNLPVLTTDTDLTQIGRRHSRDMFDNRYFSHTDLAGGSVADRAESFGITYLTIGENLGYGPDVRTVHEGLMASPNHRDNILEPSYSRIGIGVVDGGAYGIMVTQVFAD